MTSLPAPLTAQVSPVHLAAAAEPAAHWPVGYTMTVWGVALGLVTLIAVAVSTWLRLSPGGKAVLAQIIAHRISPLEFFALRSAARSCGLQTATLLIARGAMESAAASAADSDAPPAHMRRLASVARRLYSTDR